MTLLDDIDSSYHKKVEYGTRILYSLLELDIFSEYNWSDLIVNDLTKSMGGIDTETNNPKIRLMYQEQHIEEVSTGEQLYIQITAKNDRTDVHIGLDRGYLELVIGVEKPKKINLFKQIGRSIKNSPYSDRLNTIISDVSFKEILDNLKFQYDLNIYIHRTQV